MALKDKLTHKIDITGLGSLDDYGKPATGTTTGGVACFIDGRHKRVLSPNGEVEIIDYAILFLPTADIGVGYTVANGIDKSGVEILPSGRIVGVEDSNHPKKGRVVREAFVSRN